MCFFSGIYVLPMTFFSCKRLSREYFVKINNLVYIICNDMSLNAEYSHIFDYFPSKNADDRV